MASSGGDLIYCKDCGALRKFTLFICVQYAKNSRLSGCFLWKIMEIR